MGRFQFLYLACTLAALASLSESGHLENFLRIKADNFPTWLRESNLDPTPLVPGPFDFGIANGVANLNWSIRNFGMNGHTDKMALDDVNGNVIHGWFTVDFSAYGNITFFGEYSANGTIFDIPVSGEGAWYISLPFISASNDQLRFKPSLTEYLGIIERNIYIHYADLVNWNDVHFENLWDNENLSEIAEFVKELMVREFGNGLRRLGTENDPFGLLPVQYFEEIFATTKLADIIGTG